MTQIKKQFRELTREDVENYREKQKGGEELFVMIVKDMNVEEIKLIEMAKMPELNESVESFYIQNEEDMEIKSIFPILATQEMIATLN